MTAYSKPLTPRTRTARGTEQQIFPRQDVKPPPRPAMLDALATFHLYFDGAKTGTRQ